MSRRIRFGSSSDYTTYIRLYVVHAVHILREPSHPCSSTQVYSIHLSWRLGEKRKRKKEEEEEDQEEEECAPVVR